jgi:hypothetical protein
MHHARLYFATSPHLSTASLAYLTLGCGHNYASNLLPPRPLSLLRACINRKRKFTVSVPSPRLFPCLFSPASYSSHKVGYPNYKEPHPSPRSGSGGLPTALSPACPPRGPARLPVAASPALRCQLTVLRLPRALGLRFPATDRRPRKEGPLKIR